RFVQKRRRKRDIFAEVLIESDVLELGLGEAAAPSRGVLRERRACGQHRNGDCQDRSEATAHGFASFLRSPSEESVGVVKVLAGAASVRAGRPRWVTRSMARSIGTPTTPAFRSAQW